jgi:hypothetical protein
MVNPATSPHPVAILGNSAAVVAAWVPEPPGGYLPQPLRVARLDSEGSTVCASQTVDIKAENTTTTDATDGTIGSSNCAAFVWASSDNTCRAQNINWDGTSGVRT